MMWPGLNCSPRCSGGRRGCGKVWPWSAAVFSVLALLPSLTRAAVNGVPGVWMDERDAGTLALWIEEVSP